MIKLMLAALLLAGIATPASSCDVTLGPGSVVRYSEGRTGGLASVGCVAKTWEVRGWWIGEQRIYDGAAVIEAYPALSASRLWRFREGKRFEPILGFGLLAKGAQRCAHDGELDCNRQVPLPFCFLVQAGARIGDTLWTAFHCSNAGLDHGPEAKNLGLDGIRYEVWF
jgi:hypothetical protein